MSWFRAAKVGFSKLVLLSILANAAATGVAADAEGVRIVVDPASVSHTMRGGIGASWHAIEKPISTKFDPIFGLHDHGGSGWGANPPAEDNDAWQTLYRHAEWLGMDWLRVELEQRMYEPNRRQFDWDNPEMRILYRILDWCQKHKADVFLTQMWANVKWNAFPEFQGTPTGIVHSGPLSMDDFAEGLSTCVEHLVKKKGYTCIKFLCITNEPTYKWSWWNKPPNVPMPLRPGLEAVRKALDKRAINVALLAPDTVGVPAFNPANMDFHDLIGGYDFHWYDARFDWQSGHTISVGASRLAEWTKWAHAQNKGVFITELGTRAFGGGESNPGPVSYEASLQNAELVVRGIAAGADGFNRWSFTNRGDLDGQFQMVETWDRENNRLLEKFTRRANIYYVYGLLSRFTAKHSAVLACNVEGGTLEGLQRVFAVTLQSPKGNLTIAVLNDAPRQWDLALEVRGLKQPVRLYRYGVCEADRDRADLTIESTRELSLSNDAAALSDRVPPSSVTIYTTYKRSNSEPGVIAD